MSLASCGCTRTKRSPSALLSAMHMNRILVSGSVRMSVVRNWATPSIRASEQAAISIVLATSGSPRCSASRHSLTTSSERNRCRRSSLVFRRFTRSPTRRPANWGRTFRQVAPIVPRLAEFPPHRRGTQASLAFRVAMRLPVVEVLEERGHLAGNRINGARGGGAIGQRPQSGVGIIAGIRHMPPAVGPGMALLADGAMLSLAGADLAHALADLTSAGTTSRTIQRRRCRIRRG